MKLGPCITIAAAGAMMAAVTTVAPAQTPPPAGGASAVQAEDDRPPVYKPPLRGAPGGRVGGASRGLVRAVPPRPALETLAPTDHAGVTATAAPTLWFFVSRPVEWPTQLTISAPLQPAPVLETAIPPPRSAGIHAVHLADYGVQLRPGTVYTWSVSVVIDPRAWSHNIVASAAIVYEPSAAVAAAATMPAGRRAAALADAGLWYDAVTAAAEAQNGGRHTLLDALVRQVGLFDFAAADRR